MIATDETNITEIELLPDGRICVFGTSLEVLDLLDELQGGQDSNIRRRLEASRGPSNAPQIREDNTEGSLNARAAHEEP